MKIAGENIIYSFSAVHKPVAIVPAGQTLEFETKDCFCNQLRNGLSTASGGRAETWSWRWFPA